MMHIPSTERWCNSGHFDGLTTEDAFAAMVAEGEAKGVCKGTDQLPYA